MKKKRVELPAAYLDDSRRDDSSYWAAALVLAIKSGNRSNELSARANLRRLGLDVVAYGETVLPSGDTEIVSVRLRPSQVADLAAPAVDEKRSDT